MGERLPAEPPPAPRLWVRVLAEGWLSVWLPRWDGSVCPPPAPSTTACGRVAVSTCWHTLLAGRIPSPGPALLLADPCHPRPPPLLLQLRPPDGAAGQHLSSGPAGGAGGCQPAAGGWAGKLGGGGRGPASAHPCSTSRPGVCCRDQRGGAAAERKHGCVHGGGGGRGLGPAGGARAGGGCFASWRRQAAYCLGSRAAAGGSPTTSRGSSSAGAARPAAGSGALLAFWQQL